MAPLKMTVYESLRKRIITIDLKPGELLKETELMAHYGIGRSPLRDILMQLERDDLINRFPRSGTVVTPVDINHLRHITEIRVPLEGLAGQLAAERISDVQLNDLQKILEKVNQLENSNEGSMETFMELDSQFHKIIYEACNNPKLGNILQDLQGIYSRVWHYIGLDRNDILNQFNDLREMWAALAIKDGERAKKSMEQHIFTFVKQFSRKMSM